ncbi:chlorite dismutase family protein [Candidatus Chlorohelix sp.]|uniref:chlorite dismutase family protein n=1 Tax=Candidatus Chlorohelix sp. TaxID=3139201 RepID=UPI00305AE66B
MDDNNPTKGGSVAIPIAESYDNPSALVTPEEQEMKQKLGLRGGRVMPETPELKVEYKHNATKQQFVKFSFYKLDPAFRRLPIAERQKGVDEFLQAMDGLYPRGELLRPYSLTGVRGDVDFMLWHVVPVNKDGESSSGLERFQEANATVLGTGLGSYLTVPVNYTALTKRSIYTEQHFHTTSENERLRVEPWGAKYLFVYPFVKTRQWYLLSKEERQRVMDEHIIVGHQYPTVKLNTSYSFGLDDQDFVVAFETDYPSDFLDLIMELRETESSLFTVRDVPIFTCVSTTVEQIIKNLGL